MRLGFLLCLRFVAKIIIWRHETSRTVLYSPRFLNNNFKNNYKMYFRETFLKRIM